MLRKKEEWYEKKDLGDDNFAVRRPIRAKKMNREKEASGENIRREVKNSGFFSF